MKWSYQEIAQDGIIFKDSPFDWSLDKRDETLSRSLETEGILMPFVVQAVESNQFRLVDGFKRLQAIQQLKNKTIPSFPCLVIPSSISLVQIALWRLATQSNQRPFTGLEVCRMLAILAEMGIAESLITKQILPKLGLKPSQKMTEELLRLGSILEMTDSSFLKHQTPEELLPLLKFSPEEIDCLFQNLKELTLGGNKWKSLLQLFNEVGRFRNWPLAQIMESPEVVRILHNPQIQPPVRFRLLKQQLEVWRYPELTLSREKFEQGVKKLQLPAQSGIQYDPFFEKDDLTLKIQASSLEELTEQLNALQQTLEREAWETLFQLIHGE